MGQVTESPVSVERRGDLTVVALRPRVHPDDPVARWMVDAVAALIAEVRDVARDGAPAGLALVLEAPTTSGPQEHAAAQALAGAVRGIAQSLALELAPDTRVNAVLCDEPGAGDTTLALLGDPEGAFITGSTVDLRDRA
jgi:hypothetical protein